MDRYPSTPHLPFSPEVNDDDTQLSAESAAAFVGCEVVITEKLDGGNCCLWNGQVFARTHKKEASHASFTTIKDVYRGIQHVLDELDPERKWALFGENMTAIHSIAYDRLTAYFYLFGVWDTATRVWLAWDQVQRIARALGIPSAPLLFRGVFSSSDAIQKWMETQADRTSAVSTCVRPEGFVMRLAQSVPEAAFERSFAKFVRRGHVQTKDDWLRTWKKAALVAGEEHEDSNDPSAAAASPGLSSSACAAEPQSQKATETMPQPLESCLQTAQMNLERALQLLKISPSDVALVYLYGSRLWGTCRPDSDWDLIVVLKALGELGAAPSANKKQRADKAAAARSSKHEAVPSHWARNFEKMNTHAGLVDASILSQVTFRARIAEHHVLELLPLYLPPEAIWFTDGVLLPSLRASFTVDRAKLHDALQSDVQRDMALARKLTGKGQYAAALGKIQACHRALLVAAQISAQISVLANDSASAASASVTTASDESRSDCSAATKAPRPARGGRSAALRQKEARKEARREGRTRSVSPAVTAAAATAVLSSLPPVVPRIDFQLLRHDSLALPSVALPQPTATTSSEPTCAAAASLGALFVNTLIPGEVTSASPEIGNGLPSNCAADSAAFNPAHAVFDSSASASVPDHAALASDVSLGSERLVAAERLFPSLLEHVAAGSFVLR